MGDLERGWKLAVDTYERWRGCTTETRGTGICSNPKLDNLARYVDAICLLTQRVERVQDESQCVAIEDADAAGGARRKFFRFT